MNGDSEVKEMEHYEEGKTFSVCINTASRDFRRKDLATSEMQP